MAIFHPVRNKSSPTVFNVKLIEPSESPHPQTITEKIRPVRKKSPPRRYTKPPETLLGEGLDESVKSSDAKEISRDPSLAKDDKAGRINVVPSDNVKSVPYAFLFDRETIERFAKKQFSGDKKGLSFDAPEFRHRGYMRMLKQRIESIWKYPEDAARQGLSGDLYITFSIKRDGSLDRVELIRTSGYRSLDEAAIKAITDAQPFWPLPEDWQKDTLVINGHFIYILGNTVIM